MSPDSRIWPAAAVVLALLVTAGCARHLPPAETPTRSAPSVEGPAPAEGQGRLVIDVVDGPTQVQRVRMASERIDDGKGGGGWVFYEDFEALCSTSPCAVDLPPGNLLLAFPVLGDTNDVEVELVHVEREPTVYRRALSRYDGGGAWYVLGVVGTTFGGMSAVTGMVFLPIGLAKGDDGFTTAGAITLGVGTALVGLSILAILADRPSYRPGSAIHFELDEGEGREANEATAW